MPVGAQEVAIDCLKKLAPFRSCDSNDHLEWAELGKGSGQQSERSGICKRNRRDAHQTLRRHQAGWIELVIGFAAWMRPRKRRSARIATKPGSRSRTATRTQF